MSKLSTALTASHGISLTAMEEASREGLRTADIEHMLLALVLDSGTAGQVLRSMPITLDEARVAVIAQHAEQLQSLGIIAPIPSAGKIVFHETGGYEWSERALDIIKQSSSKGMNGGAPDMLRALLAEPSDLIRSLLLRLGTTPEAVAAKLDEALQIPSHSPRAMRANHLSGSATSFVPAPVDQVWAALTKPTNISQWDAPATTDSKQAASHAELTESGEPYLVEWLFTFPVLPNANAKRVRIELEPAAGGTQLRTTLSWEPRTPRKRIPGLRIIMRPLVRFSIWMQLSHLGDGISRMFR